MSGINFRGKKMEIFTGFPKQLPEFFAALKKNNSREWFQENKDSYETYVKQPSQKFVSAMGDKLASICPGINAIPQINKSLFRLNRDTRFSHDKSPYKTNLGILMWDGPGKRMESPGFYFHVEDQMLMLGCGLYMLPKKILSVYRDAVSDPKKARKLESVVSGLRDRGYVLGTKHYKRMPAGYEARDGFTEEFLLYNGLSAKIEMEIPESFYSGDIIDFVFNHYKAMYPLHQWIKDFL